jgi:thioredoxin-dependent peroxiredoxin
MTSSSKSRAKLAAGDKAPAFALKDKNGAVHRLSGADSEHVVLYFYPKDDTPGCTLEAQGFTKDLKKFKALDTAVIGISGGDEKSKQSFCSKYKLNLTLLSDPDFKVARKYGVYGLKKFMGRSYMGIRRTTFVLDKRHKIAKVYEEVDPARHSREVLEFLKKEGDPSPKAAAPAPSKASRRTR